MAGKKQHYVPQFLLRNFSHRGAAGKISAYRFASRKFLPRTSVRDQAHENNFYGNPQIEGSLAGLEGEAARILEAAIREEALPELRSSDHHALLTFVLAQAFRTRAAADESNAMADRLAKRVMRDVPGLREHLDLVEVTITNAPLYALGRAAMSFDLAHDLHFKLLCNRTPTPFVASDAPAVLYNQFLEPRKKTGSNTGIAIKGLQLFLPVGPRHLVLFFDPAVYVVGSSTSRRVDVTSTADVDAMNVLQAVNAAETLYFNDDVALTEVESLVGRAATLRPLEAAGIIEYQPASGDLINDGVLLRMFTPDVRTGLRLSFVCLTAHAERYDVRSRLIHHRDPGLCKLHERFVKEVYAGRYLGGEFKKFLDDVANSLPRGQPPFGRQRR